MAYAAHKLSEFCIKTVSGRSPLASFGRLQKISGGKLVPTSQSSRQCGIRRFWFILSFLCRIAAYLIVGPSYFFRQKPRFIANESRGAREQIRGGLVAYAAHKLSESCIKTVSGRSQHVSFSRLQKVSGGKLVPTSQSSRQCGIRRFWLTLSFLCCIAAYLIVGPSYFISRKPCFIANISQVGQ